jgi:hypothetical protein
MTTPRRLAGILLSLSGFFFVILYLQGIDVFSTHFGSTGPTMLGYNLSRILFLFYFAWILAGVGWLVTDFLKLNNISLTLGFVDRQLLCMFIGAALLTLIMFPVGLLNLYYPTTAIILTIPILIFSFPNLLQTAREARAHWRSIFTSKKSVRLERLTLFALFLAFGSLCLTLLVTRVLYPGECGNDVYEHYLPYQREVIRTHGLGPNDVWMQFYYSKGAGLSFLAMLLTDDLASQSVNYILLLMAAAAVYSIVTHLTEARTWGGLAAVVSLACFPFSNPQWAAFQSHHLGVCAMVIGMIWFATLTFTLTAPELKAWFGLWMIFAAAQVIFFPPSLLFTLPVLFALGAIHWLKSQNHLAKNYLILTVSTATILLGLLSINYAFTGLFLDIPLGQMWRIGDQVKFSSWCSPYLPFCFMEGASETKSSFLDFSKLLESHQSQGYWIKASFQNEPYWLNLYRLSEMPGLFFGAGSFCVLVITFAIAFFRKRSTPGFPGALFIPVILVTLLTVLVAATPGYPVNLYRNYGFVAFLSASILCGLWKVFFDFFVPSKFRPIVVVLFILTAASICTLGAFNRASLQRPIGEPSRFKDFMDFAIGKISTEEALKSGDGLWSAALEAKSRIGINEKIFCFNNNGFLGSAAHSFPGNGLLTEPSRSSFNGKWHVIAFGDALQAKEELEKQGINHFLIDFKSQFFGCIPFSSLFDPDYMMERFDLVWADATTCLFTWKGYRTAAIPSIPSLYVELMRQRVQHWSHRPEGHPDRIFGSQYQNLKAIYDFNQGGSYPLKRPNNLPRLQGWD